MSNECVAREFYSQNLPNDTWVEVFSHLSNVESMSNCMIVFKHVRVSPFIVCFK